MYFSYSAKCRTLHYLNITYCHTYTHLIVWDQCDVIMTAEFADCMG